MYIYDEKGDACYEEVLYYYTAADNGLRLFYTFTVEVGYPPTVQYPISISCTVVTTAAPAIEKSMCHSSSVYQYIHTLRWNATYIHCGGNAPQ